MARFPKVLVNFAMSADGKISTRKETPSNFTSKRDKRRLSEIRSLGDAVMVGRNTVATDAMSLGLSAPDLRGKRVDEGKSPAPLRVIVSNMGRFDLKWKVFTNSDSPLLLCTAAKISQRFIKKLPSFVSIQEFPEEKIPMEELLEILRSKWGVKRLVCEGGPTLFNSLLAVDAVDEIYLTIAPVVFGGVKAMSLSGLPDCFCSTEYRFRLKSLEDYEGEAFLHYLRDRPQTHGSVLGKSR